MMRLLILTFYYPPDLCAGSFRSGALARALLKKLSSDDVIDVVTTFPNRYGDFHPSSGRIESVGNITIHRVKLPSHASGMIDQVLAYFWYSLFVFKTIAFNKYDRVFATSSRLFTAFLGSIVSIKKKSPLYLDIRDIFVENMDELLKSKSSRLILPLLRKFEQFTLKRASYLNCVSKGFEPYFKNRYKGRIQYHTNGIDPEFLQRSWANTATQKKMVVTYAGNIGEGQGLHLLFPAIAQEYPEIEFRIIGNGGKKEELQRRVNKLENVKLLAPMRREEILRHYDESDALLLHLNALKSFERVLPSKVFEYGATGKLILAGVSGYARRFIEDNIPDAICFDPGDVKQLKKKFAGHKGGNGDRRAFIEKYAREAIMDRFAEDILKING